MYGSLWKEHYKNNKKKTTPTTETYAEEQREDLQLLLIFRGWRTTPLG